MPDFVHVLSSESLQHQVLVRWFTHASIGCSAVYSVGYRDTVWITMVKCIGYSVVYTGTVHRSQHRLHWYSIEVTA